MQAGGKVARPGELMRNLIYVIIAEAANMGLSAMAESYGVPYDVLTWTPEWHFRPETGGSDGPRRPADPQPLTWHAPDSDAARSVVVASQDEAGNAAVVNYHHRLPLTRAFGSGTLSSSDGQRFPIKSKSITARHLSQYFARGQGVSKLRTSRTSTRPSTRR